MSTRLSSRPRRASFPSLLLLSLAIAALGACNLDFSQGIEEKDSWTRSYSLEKGGTLDLRDTNGSIHIQAVDGDKVEVKATRVVKASTPEAAKAELAKFEIKEESSPTLVRIDSTGGTTGLHIGLSKRVDYEITVPRWADVTVRSTNGEITVRDIGGMLTVNAINGRITGTGLEKAAEVETVNGQVDLEFAKLGDNGVRCKTTNGMITVTIPRTARASLSASVANGGISTENLDVTDTDESRRAFEGTLNGGGAEIRLSTINGAIKIAGR